jgi:hypothetical protein
MSRLRLGLGVPLVALLLAAAPASALGPPAVAVAVGSSTRVLDADGAAVRTFPSYRFWSLAGTLLAGDTAVDRVVGRDALTGSLRFRIRNAFGPVALGGARVAFLPDHSGRRDPQVNSVWLRRQNGTIRKLVQFSNGGSLPGIRTGIDSATILGFTLDAAGRTMAVVEGNDVDVFRYDVWVVDVPSRSAFRATTGRRSRHATITPNGARIAFLREETTCGGPPPGFRAGDLVVMPTQRGAPRTVIVDGTCVVFYTEPRWVSDTVLAAVRLTRTAPGVYAGDLVLVNASSHAVEALTAHGDVFGVSASPTLDTVAFSRGAGVAVVLDLPMRTPVDIPGGFAPKLAGDRSWP